MSDFQPGMSAPLAEAQAGLWYAQRLDPANPIFNTARYIALRGALDLDAFKRAVEQAATEADTLSLTFRTEGEAVTQTLQPGLAPRLEIIDLTGEADPESQALAFMRRDLDTPLDPSRDGLARDVLFILKPGHSLWYQRVHHLAVDGYGMGLLAQRAAQIYAGLIGQGDGGKPLAPLAPVWAEDAAYRASERRVQDAAFWRSAMEGAPDVVGLAPGRAISAHRAHRTQLDLGGELLKRLQERAARAGLSWPDLITAIAAAYCRRFSGAGEAIVGMPYMGRLGSASARAPAMVMNILPLRLRPDETAPLDVFLTEASKAMVQARRHGRYRSEQLRRDLGLLGGARRLFGPLINILPFDSPAFAGLDSEMHILATGPVDDLTFTFRGGGGAAGFDLEIEANPDLYSVGEAAGHGRRIAAFLEAALGAERLADVPIATPEEAQAEVFGFNATQHPVPQTTLVALIEDSMQLRPREAAVVFEGQSLTYAQLDARTEALAQALVARGVGAEQRVAVAMPRSLEMIIAMVAVMRAGGAYLPLDLDHPPARLAALIEVSTPAAILAFEDLHGLFGPLLLKAADWPAEPQAQSLAGPAPGDPAYIIYTSGSTGAPKGVVIEHQAIVNRLLWMGEHYGFGPADRILQKTPTTFDVSVWELFLSFITGGTLVIAPPGAHRSPPEIARLIRQHGITALHFVPSMLAVFLDDPAARGLGVRRVFCSGEALPSDLRDRFHRIMKAELHNLYGPTEAAVDVSYWPAGPQDRSNPLPIGWPVWNTSLIVLDEHMHPAAPGMVGQLHLGGVQLARGYLGRPDLTAERFVPDPFRPGERLYRAGDVARRRLDGAVVYLGRADDQVKIRGLRIELGEIETAINLSGLARASAVIAREDRAGDKRLVGYVVPTDSYSPEALRASLAARLPDYMVPAALVTLETLPVTANGKLDRGALPAPQIERRAGRPPANDTERRVAQLYAEVLGLDTPPGAEDDFFELGGDSLSAVRLLLRVQEEWSRDPGLGALFEQGKVMDLAAMIDAETPDFDHGLGPVIRLAQGDERLAPLFVVHPAGGLAWGYRTLANALSPRRTVYGLQAPTVDPSAPVPADIDALASAYADRIVGLGTRGPVLLAGWSVGGIIAQAMAVRLAELGRKVGMVAMFDSYPAECWRAEPEPDEIAALRALIAIAGHDPLAYPELTSREAITQFLRQQGGPIGALPSAAMDGVIRTVLDTNRLIRQHYHRRYPGTLLHVRAALDHHGRDLTPQLWAPHAETIEVFDAPFLHPELTGAAATAFIAPELDRRMAAAEQENS